MGNMHEFVRAQPGQLPELLAADALPAGQQLDKHLGEEEVAVLVQAVLGHKNRQDLPVTYEASPDGPWAMELPVERQRSPC